MGIFGVRNINNMDENEKRHSWQGDKDYEAVFKAHYAHLCLFANRIVKDFAEAEDIVQEVFVRFWDKRKGLHKAISVKSYLYSAVYNSCMNYLKRKKYIEERMADYPAEEATSENYLQQRVESEVMEEIFRTIELLPEECKKVFKLSYVEEKEISEVAQILNISETTVKTQRARARKFLRERLKNVFPVVMLLFPGL